MSGNHNNSNQFGSSDEPTQRGVPFERYFDSREAGLRSEHQGAVADDEAAPCPGYT